ncbi:hypothetical protein NCCP2716_27050 [Sporosarcina sp. NCCP-2716]|uniref:hypothetical protein n=1 Tax=Sporosarcina sp. NCCP-2716 TaxID=2943679 RepID=UPI00203F0F31|nr:hypothetical protein [Sporosarcina sp. NCCP-2716]GKV70207.1 hypothetical protein NCCP2716_27050 [Sporosarcina sp. NCCP-2716]
MEENPLECEKHEYEEHLLPIDDEICALVKKRLEQPVDHTAFPSEQMITSLAEKHGLHEELVSALFNTLEMEEYFRPRVDPVGFRKHLPVLQSVEIGDRLYSVTFVRQYKNASVVNLNADWDGTQDSPHEYEPNTFELSIGDSYDCRMDSGSGSTGYSHTTYIVTPLPDDLAGIDLTFTEYTDHVRKKPTGVAFVMRLS